MASALRDRLPLARWIALLVPAALLALVVQGLFEAIERGLVPRGLRLAARS